MQKITFFLALFVIIAASTYVTKAAPAPQNENVGSEVTDSPVLNKDVSISTPEPEVTTSSPNKSSDSSSDSSEEVKASTPKQ